MVAEKSQAIRGGPTWPRSGLATSLKECAQVVLVVTEKSQAIRIAVLVVGDKSQGIRTVVFVVAEWLLRSLRQYGVARHGPIQIYCDFTIGSHLVSTVLLDVNKDGPSWPRHAFCVYIQNSISIWLHRTKTSSTMIANSTSKWFKQGCPRGTFCLNP